MVKSETVHGDRSLTRKILSTEELDMGWYDNDFAEIVGATVERVFWSSDRMILDTDKGTFIYDVEGECCSYSYFHDFIGIKKLLNNGPVVGFESVDLEADDIEDDGYNCTQVYGYRFETEHPKWGLMSSVVSFRNESNGYYGGWMNAQVTAKEDLPGILSNGSFEELTSDKIG
jgi:hypothetical protein